eukprot:TRINITY_DN27029_c0_g1_i1.p1 TRINITY_DN27029_c0_g1~~TRINITY_DN27029_c0_g1_i1.p1  ORF type:complete len:269 (+),score=130.23 TRINITY_DN27029_c0_g1_i1:69-875(+)
MGLARALVLSAALLLCGTAVRAEGEVKLLKAESRVNSKNGVYQLISFDVVVKNIAPEKQVWVRYHDIDGWKNLALGFSKQFNDEKELWHAEARRVVTDVAGRTEIEQPKIDLEFAIGYHVAGEEHWDNNCDRNYHVPANSGELITSEVLVDGVRGGRGEGEGSPVYLELDVLVKNLAYKKDVQVRYTADNWKTSHEAPLEFSLFKYEGYTAVHYPNANNIEYWKLPIPTLLDVPATAIEIKFAVRFSPEPFTNTCWDNNFGNDYTLPL